MKVVVWLDSPIRAFHLQPEQVPALESCLAGHDLFVVHRREDFLEQLADAEGALVWQFPAAWYEQGAALRFVGTPAAGREWVDEDPSGRVRVLRGTFHGKIMAETLLAMMLFHTRRLASCLEDQRARRYDRDSYSSTRRLAGQRVLILGYGPLGRECARLLKGVGMEVVGVKRAPSGSPEPADAVYSVERLPELLPAAEHLVITLPGDTGTDRLLSDQYLELLPPGASLYNLGRGNTVDEAALLRALSSGHLAHAFLDVFEQEPLPEDSPLWSTPHLTLMPHASAISSEYLELWLAELAEELAARSRR